MGLDRLNTIAMMLIAIGENLQRLDRLIGQENFDRFPDIDWVGAKGLRNLLSHNYFSIDAQEVYRVCSDEIPNLKQAINAMRSTIF